MSIDSVEGLRSYYAMPRQRSLDKEVDHLDVHCRDFIAHSPFVVLSTTCAGGSRVDASPKGGPAGFVRVLDDHTLAIPDMSGNNRLDSMRNIVDGGAVACLFFVPGVDETMRVNGSASVSVESSVLSSCSVAGMDANVAVVVSVSTAFIHCAKALRRSSLWDPAGWPSTADMATPACMLKDHLGLEGSAEDSQRALDESYARTTWAMGADPATRPATSA